MTVILEVVLETDMARQGGIQMALTLNHLIQTAFGPVSWGEGLLACRGRPRPTVLVVVA